MNIDVEKGVLLPSRFNSGKNKAIALNIFNSLTESGDSSFIDTNNPKGLLVALYRIAGNKRAFCYRAEGTGFRFWKL